MNNNINNYINEREFIENTNEDAIIKKLDELSLVSIIKYKKNLSLNFIIKYILNDKYYGLSEEYDIDILMILKYQPHLTYKQIKYAITKKY